MFLIKKLLAAVLLLSGPAVASAALIEGTYSGTVVAGGSGFITPAALLAALLKEVTGVGSEALAAKLNARRTTSRRHVQRSQIS